MEIFNKERSKEDGYKIMESVRVLMNDIGRSFLDMNGGSLAEKQSKLIGYKFYLADYMTELNRVSETLKMEVKESRARRWDEVTETIRAKEGKVKNKEQIENVLLLDLREKMHTQMLYETLYNKYKLKISSIDSVLTAIAQRIKELSTQMRQEQ